MAVSIDLAERGLLPDSLLRMGIRGRLRRQVRAIETETESARETAIQQLVRAMDEAPIAPEPKLANRQHYEVPAAFFECVLGERLKYSCCHWPAGTRDLHAAERAMLERTCENARLEDGMDILELGCGWGSLSLWMAETYPLSKITAVTNSVSQKAYIDSVARERGITNLWVLTADMNDFHAQGTFDRVVSVEMFEHMRNYRKLLRRIRGWLRPGARLFVHVFCHRRYPYLFEVDDNSDWMARHFFTGGLMPSNDLLNRFPDEMAVERHVSFSGEHYERTARAWLARLDLRRDDVLGIFRDTYGDDARRWFCRWRMFFLACEELFGLHRGQEWWVSHYLLRPPDES